MKRNGDIREILGLTQQEIATALNVSRSLWAMFESGQRSLPLHATQTLAALLTHAQQNTAKPAPRNMEAEQTLLKRLLHENAYQQQLTRRKLDALEKKSAGHERLQQVAQYLEAQNRHNKKLTPPHHKQLIAKAQKDKPDDGTTRFALELKLELLALEEKLLLAKPEPGSNKE